MSRENATDVLPNVTNKPKSCKNPADSNQNRMAGQIIQQSNTPTITSSVSSWYILCISYRKWVQPDGKLEEPLQKVNRANK